MRLAAQPTHQGAARLIGAAGIVLVTIFGNLPGDRLLWRTLEDFAHCPAFIALSIIAISSWPAAVKPRKAITVTVLGCALVGVGIEFAQSFTGGDTSADDVFTDLLGTTIGLSLYARYSGRWSLSPTRRLWLAIAATAAFVVALVPVAWTAAAYANRDLKFPTLASFRTPLDLAFIDMDGTFRIERLPSQLSIHDGETAIRVDIPAHRDYSGVFLDEPHADWSGYETLVLDLANAGDEAIVLRLRVHDRQHDQALTDRFNETITLAARSRQSIRIPIEQIAHAPVTRRMDLRAISGVGLFSRARDEDAAFYVARISLVRAAD